MSVAAARCVGIGISGRLVGIEQIEIVEVDPLIGFVPRKRHNHVDEEPDPGRRSQKPEEFGSTAILRLGPVTLTISPTQIRRSGSTHSNKRFKTCVSSFRKNKLLILWPGN